MMLLPEGIVIALYMVKYIATSTRCSQGMQGTGKYRDAPSDSGT
jgi:hypothetical protein